MSEAVAMHSMVEPAESPLTPLILCVFLFLMLVPDIA
jgi:hypothetical protein